MTTRFAARTLTSLAVAACTLALGASAALAQDVELPGAYFPEGIDRSDDGQFFVGSFVTGDIETFQAGDTTTTTFSSGVLDMAIGLYVDASIDTLWACGMRTVDVGGGVLETQVGLQGFDLDSGAPVAFHAFPGGGFCNDIAQDERGNLYATDSLGFRIVTVAADDRLSDSPVETWLADPAFELEPGEGTGLSINGIAYGKHRLWVVNISRGELYEIKVKGNGAPGTLRTIALDRPLAGPDGIEFIDHKTLVVIENFASAISRIDLCGHSGTVSTIASGLGDSPTTFTLAEDQFWIAIGQLDRLFGNPNPPTFPFVVTTVPVPGDL